MTTKRKVEVFSAGCPACETAISQIRAIACPSCEVIVLDMNDDAAAKRANVLGVASVPAVAIDRKLANCASDGGRTRPCCGMRALDNPLRSRHI